MGLSSPTGCCWSFRLRKIRLFLGDAVQNNSRDGKAETEAETEEDEETEAEVEEEEEEYGVIGGNMR